MCESLTDVRNHSSPGADTGAGFLAKKKTNPGLGVFFYKDNPPLPAELPCL